MKDTIMKKFGRILRVAVGVIGVTWSVAVLTGCRSEEEIYYRELTPAQELELKNSARAFAVSSGKLSDPEQTVVTYSEPMARITYSGDYSGKAEYRWEVYPPSEGVLSTATVNARLVRVYAQGNLRSPEWKLSCSMTTPVVPEKAPVPTLSPGKSRVNRRR